MNYRPKNRETIEPSRQQKRIGKPISKLDLLLRGVAAVAFALFGIALALDADEMRSLVGEREQAEPARLASDVEAIATSADEASQWQLDDGDEFELPRVVTAEGTAESDESVIVPVAGTQAEPKTLAERPARSVLDSGKSEVWSLMPEPKPAVKPTAKPAADKRTSSAGVARVARPAKALPKRVVIKTDTTGRARVVNRQPVKRPATANSSPLKVNTPKPAKRPETVAKKATVRPPVVKATPVSKTKNIKQLPVTTAAKIEPTPDPAFTLQLNKAPQKTVTVPGPAKTTPQQTPLKQPKRVTLKDRLARLYSPLTKKKPRQQKKESTNFKRAKTVPPAEQVAQPKSVVAKVEVPKKKANGIPVWALDGPTSDVKSKNRAIQVTATKPDVKQLPRQLSPPHAVRSTPQRTDAVKTANENTTKPAQKQRGLRRFGLGGIVGKLFPSKKPQTVAKAQKAADATKKPQRSPVAKAKTVEQTSGSTTSKPTFTLTLDSRNSDTLSKDAIGSPAGGAADYLSTRGLDELVVDQAPVEAPMPPAKAPALPLDAEVTQVAAADPVFDLVPLDQPNSPFRLPVMATRQAEKVEDAPPAPTGEEAKSNEDTLGYFDFKPVGELTVDINAIKGEDPPNLAKPEFEKVEPVVLDTTWIDQTLTAQTFPFYHQPLYFEDPNAERCGDTWGLLQPAMSAAQFYLTIPVLPYLIGAYPPNEEVESLGDCPYGCKYKLTDAYVPRFSWKGVALQGAATTGMIYLIP